MAGYNQTLDFIFQSLAGGTHCDMLQLLCDYDKMSVVEIAAHYRITFASTAKHLKVLESAKLIAKRWKGKQQMVSLSPTAFKTADSYLDHRPISVIPCGKNWAVAEYGRLTIPGYLASRLRKIADLVGYMDIMGQVREL
ncbi:winged helix-turn-helix transcriptional regulator [Candidatus Saccharibacteria bacterium]|nr:winged helix-turn-helix transcriptional regulator [Candidatus Saccharibacteria bacterium]